MPDETIVRKMNVYYDGTIDGITHETVDGEVVAIEATITREIRGVVVSRRLRLDQAAIGRLGHMIAPGRAALCGVLDDDVFHVIGPDLRKRTLIKAETRAYRPRRENRSPARILRDRFFARRHYAKLKAERLAHGGQTL
jgi:hypothetical protein